MHEHVDEVSHEEHRHREKRHHPDPLLSDRTIDRRPGARLSPVGVPDEAQKQPEPDEGKEGHPQIHHRLPAPFWAQSRFVLKCGRRTAHRRFRPLLSMAGDGKKRPSAPSPQNKTIGQARPSKLGSFKGTGLDRSVLARSLGRTARAPPATGPAWTRGQAGHAHPGAERPFPPGSFSAWPTGLADG